MKDNPPLKEIIGDSKGKEAAEKIHDWLRDNCPYKTYEQDYIGFKQELKPDLKPEIINCYDGHNPRLEEEKRKYLAKVIKEAMEK